MWVDYDNLWACYAGNAFLVLILYAVKDAALHFVGRTGLAVLTFFGAVCFCVPITWALCPDWDNEFVLPIGNYVGTPVMVLTVPAASFFFDLARWSSGHFGKWHWRVPLEMFIGIPMWACCWGFFEMAIGWVWI